MIRFTPNCKSNVNGQCSKLHVKCLESRFMDIGGVAFGHCVIREADVGLVRRVRPAPKRVSALAHRPKPPPWAGVTVGESMGAPVACFKCLSENHPDAIQCTDCGAEL